MITYKSIASQQYNNLKTKIFYKIEVIILYIRSRRYSIVLKFWMETKIRKWQWAAMDKVATKARKTALFTERRAMLRTRQLHCWKEEWRKRKYVFPVTPPSDMYNAVSLVFCGAYSLSRCASGVPCSVNIIFFLLNAKFKVGRQPFCLKR